MHYLFFITIFLQYDKNNFSFYYTLACEICCSYTKLYVYINLFLKYIITLNIYMYIILFVILW